jgi:inosine-uridine nucleoside N-ribohydrolase
MNSKKHYILIDCDPGGDDIFALLWLLINHKFAHVPMEVIGITTVWWNVRADLTYMNALRMCEFVWVDVPVAKDHRQIASEDASHIHGSDGIGGLSSMLPSLKLPDMELDSIDMIVQAIQMHGSDLTILATGPMTNLALAEQRVPGILQQCKRIIAMGGAISLHGNVTPVAEFNIAYDPMSAKIVFDVTDNLMLAPLDLTTSMVFDNDDMMNCFREINHGNKQAFMFELTNFLIKTNMQFRETGYEHGFYVHDAHTVWLLLYPHLYEGAFQQVMVETQGEYTKGETIIDQRNIARVQTNAFIAMKFNKALFLEAMTQDLRMFDFS